MSVPHRNAKKSESPHRPTAELEGFEQEGGRRSEITTAKSDETEILERHSGTLVVSCILEMHQNLPERRRRAVIVSLFELQQREVLGEGRRVQLRARLTRIGNRRVEEGACIVERA